MPVRSPASTLAANAVRTLPDHGERGHADARGAGEGEDLRSRNERPGGVRLGELERQAHRARVAEALDRAPQLGRAVGPLAHVLDALLDEALRGLVAEDEVEVAEAPARARHDGVHGRRHELEADLVEPPPVAEEAEVDGAAAQLAGLRGRAEAAADGELPVAGIASVLALTEAARRIITRLDHRRAAAIADDEAGDRAHEVLHRARSEGDRDRGALPGGYQHAAHLA